MALHHQSIKEQEFSRNKDEAAKKYLRHYNYISQSRFGNQHFRTAIDNFQLFAGLRETGRVDHDTETQMKRPRCAMRDVDNDGRPISSYKLRSKWNKKHLTYFVEHGKDLEKENQDRIFARALQYWADVSGLSFSRASSASSADLKISFGSSSHGGKTERKCAYPFDGFGEVLAHAYFPSDGRVHFDEAERYTDESTSGTNLLSVATHEFGHALGLEHSDNKKAVMYPYYSGYVSNFRLHQDDIKGIQALYGKRRR